MRREFGPHSASSRLTAFSRGVAEDGKGKDVLTAAGAEGPREGQGHRHVIDFPLISFMSTTG